MHNDSADDWLRRQNTNSGQSCSPISRKNIRSCRRYLKVPFGNVDMYLSQLKKNPPNKRCDDQKLDVMLMLEENPHPVRRVVRQLQH
ncbi:hypothetical protein NQ318_012334 [Aromia moschata]|uniref:Uncharacterized protein n=1 Tax=Aromia moschata TaxID=1265417 RepID=A0AAV8XLI5_9CUCU|nr:hypothetical protein NQ318_012334 [Aromia moschata]